MMVQTPFIFTEFACGILRLEPECQIGKKYVYILEIETSVFEMRA